jgi:hypothetical protein
MPTAVTMELYKITPHKYRYKCIPEDEDKMGDLYIPHNSFVASAPRTILVTVRGIE